jgi:hypothetical protein
MLHRTRHLFIRLAKLAVMFAPYDKRPPASTFSQRWKAVGSRAACASSAILRPCSMTVRSASTTTPFTPTARQACECALEFLGGTSFDDLNLQVQFTNGVLGLPKLHGYVRIVAVAHDADALPVRAIAETPNAQRNGGGANLRRIGRPLTWTGIAGAPHENDRAH